MNRIRLPLLSWLMANWALVTAVLVVGCDRASPTSAPADHSQIAHRNSAREFPAEKLGPFYQAGAEIEMDHPGEASKILQSLISEGLGDPAIIANLAVAKMASQDHDAALKLAIQAADLAPDVGHIRLILAAAFWNAGRIEKAIAAIKAITDGPSADVAAYWMLIAAAEIHPDLVSQAESLAAHRRMLSTAPRNLAALLSSSRMLAEAGQLQEAAELFNRCAALVTAPEQDQRELVDAVDAAASRKDRAGLVRAITQYRNLLRRTERYRADVLELGPGILKFPRPVTHPVFRVVGRPSDAIHATVAFRKATTDLGLPDPGDTGVKACIGAVGRSRDPAIGFQGPQSPFRLYVRRDAHFEDVTARSGIPLDVICDSAILVDLNNDGLMDLMLPARSGDRVFRATPDGHFVDATTDSGLSESTGWQAACPYDFDNDGDLDLIQWSTDAIRLMRNDGEGRLTAIDGRPGFPASVYDIRSVQPRDLEDDGDVDLLIITGGGPFECRIFSNERLGTFREMPPEMTGLPASFDGEPFLCDTNADGRLEIIDPSAGWRYEIGDDFKTERFKLSLPGDGQWSRGGAADLENDGVQDLVLCRPDGTTTLENVRIAAGCSLSPVDLNGDGLMDLLASDGEAYLNESRNAGHWLSVSLKALTSGDSKFNSFGLYSTIEIRAGALYQKQHVSGPVTNFGLGACTHADVMRVIWPNGNYQDLEHRASDRLRLAADQLVVEEQSLKGSCPYLYAWNGERFEFVTDVLWRSALGMSIMSDVFGHHETADDYFKIEGSRLAPRDGEYVLQFTEELWETAYLDYVRLFVVDHPIGTEIFVDERCTFPPYPPFEIHAIRDITPIHQAWDHRGRDCTERLSAKDGRYVDGFAPTRYQGIVEDHDLTLDLGAFANGSRVRLFLSGWLFPTDASINVAVSQNPGIEARPPVIRVLADNPDAKPLDIPMGFPSGKNKMMVLDLTGALRAAITEFAFRPISPFSGTTRSSRWENRTSRPGYLN
ncbi:MAG: VCBS repeat-containing protein [Planctomycetes bacterium]|nr:VCBS repeat-containing protein [Planctomycetota bacterium]